MLKKSAKKKVAKNKSPKKKISNKNSKKPSKKLVQTKSGKLKSTLNKKNVKKQQKTNLKKDKKTKSNVVIKPQKKQLTKSLKSKEINNKIPKKSKKDFNKKSITEKISKEKNIKTSLKNDDIINLDNKKISKTNRKKNNKNTQTEIKPFQAGDFAVYPSHGVGKINEIQNSFIAGQQISCYLMFFEKDKLTIKIPVSNSEKIGLRRIVTKAQMEEVLSILRSGIKKLKGMWSRRAQEYETKINSGDIFLLAEVLRDLTRDIEDSERSYSERIIYETAIHRLASEYSIIFNTDVESAKEKIINIAKDKINSDTKSSTKDDFDDFDLDNHKSKIDSDEDEEEEDEDEEEDEEEDDFNYNFDEIDDDEEDSKTKKKKK
ncbi:hypothetical protein LBMAG18_02700 [Alphaproteobacteria bacterium]|nr:hypothetical protein LBMAG18_02700 [Alphaproteobacteria bacterium]